MSGIMLAAAMWCGAGDGVPSSFATAPVVAVNAPPLPVAVPSPSSSSLVPAVATSPAPAQAEPAAKKGSFFGSVRDRILGRPAVQQVAAPATDGKPATIVQTKAEESQPPRPTPKKAPAAKSETYTNVFGIERTRTTWTGN